MGAMTGFGSLLRSLRGGVPLKELAVRVGYFHTYLSNVEAGRRSLSEEKAKEVLRRGFGLEEAEASRVLLEAKLVEYGVRGELRPLVLDLALGKVPVQVRRELLRLYHRSKGR